MGTTRREELAWAKAMASIAIIHLENHKKS
jgi:hypothetical protein